MPDLPDHARALIYDPSDRSLTLREMPLRAPREGEILVRVSLSTLCRSDLHTASGKRSPGGPVVLGHEICGTIAALGPGVKADSRGDRPAIGDRVTWTIAASCGTCFFCTHGLPQKCVRLFKYGHQPLPADPAFNGGFAEYCYLVPGTGVYRLPDTVPDERAVFANCAVATAQAIVRHGALGPGDAVLVQGAGLLGLSVAAIARDAGASVVAVSDVAPQRLERALRFGATHTLDAASCHPGSLRPHTRQERGFDVAVEVCGRPEVLPQGIEALRTGGAYVIAGSVFPHATVELDLHQVIFKHLRLQGVHNYVSDDLSRALEFIGRAGADSGFADVVAETFALDDYAQAFARAESGPEILRVALRP